jgi:hypothetical protein
MLRSQWPGRLLFLVLLAAPARGWSAPPVCEVVHDDWYFRESLTAIRDWESILERWERATPEARRTPLFPVPHNGEAAVWPNPVPPMLLPANQRGPAVRVRLVDGSVQIQRQGFQGQATPETVKLDAQVVGDKHPGGGGKDQWYHKYDRKFDRLTTFCPKPAPLAAELEGPLDWRRGNNVLSVRLRNVSGQPLPATLKLDFHAPTGQAPISCGRQTVTLPSGVSQSVRFPVALRAVGGGLLILTVDAGAESFWLPIFTYVEDVCPILASIQQILADAPDPRAASRLAGLRGRLDHWESAGAAWSALFEEASQLRDELLLGRIHFDTLLFVKRKPFYSEQPFMDAHHLYNRPGGAVYRLSPVCPSGKITPVVDSLGEGVYRDLCLDWDARRFLFSFGNGSDTWDGKQSYHVYECALDGSRPRQLTFGPKNDCEPFYLPDGTIGFTSDRSEHFVMCGGDRHAPNLFVMARDGSELRRLSFNVFNDFTPSVLDDGRILYGRWEYNERSVTSLHHPFTVHPDGTMVSPYYGNATIRPNVVMFARPVPASHKVMALFTAHHGQTHGAVGLIDVRRGIDGPGPLELLTPGVPLMGEKAEDSRCGWFSDPVPLSENTWLCSFTPTVVPWLEWSWGLYVADRHGHLALVYRDPNISCAEPAPVVKRPRPHVLPHATEVRAQSALRTEDAAEATLVLGDVYQGLPGVARGTARYLRILEDVPRQGVHQGGVICTSGTSIYTIKRVLGTVPIEADGSAHFVVPADRNVYFEVLDPEQREIQRMRSVVCLKPAETRSCVGCHERPHTAPPGAVDRPVRQALGHPASRPVPPPWGTKIVSFLRDVQPVLNARCVGCHAYDRAANRVVLTDDLTDQFTIGYEELVPYLSVANSMRWDNPDDVYARGPYTYGSKVSRLAELLSSGHHGVSLTEDERLRLVNWIDANGVYYDRYETVHYAERRIFTGTARKTIEDVCGRRCAACHGSGDGRFDTWALSLNRRDVRLSRLLAAPLARSAGGWGLCEKAVFADAGDPDYQALRAVLGSLHEALQKRPREDLLSIRGTPAEVQSVEFPPLPPLVSGKTDLPGKDWVHLSDLPWESARAGWSPNNDGLPRRDQDIEDRTLRLGPRKFRKGIGTHAPSEIVYRLDGKYARFFVEVGGAEAGGTVVFQVFGDDKLLYQSGLLHGRNEVKTADVPTAGARRLRLVVTDGGDGYAHDMANWAGARLQRVPDAGK